MVCPESWRASAHDATRMTSRSLAVALIAAVFCSVGAAQAPPGLGAGGLPADAGAGAAVAGFEGPWATVDAQPSDTRSFETWWVQALIFLLWGVIGLILLYTVRHYVFTINRLLARQEHPFATVDTMDWPTVTVWVPCHNEEAVVAGTLEALLRADYPADRLTIMPVNDRSTDGTRAIIEAYEAQYPTRIRALHRTDGHPGKAAALNDACELTDTDLVLNFDADYLPGRDLIKQLVAPFADPTVGAVMGRVVPVNAGANLLTRLQDLERTGGYQVDQQARMNMGLVPQYGGTCGGLRRSALDAVGGWRASSLTEDTDITCHLVAEGWRVVYVNRAECYEESPETWPVRVRQIGRWARGHTDSALRYAGSFLTSRSMSFWQRVDGLMLLGVYAMGPVLLLGWALAMGLFYLGVHPAVGLLALLAVAGYNTLGNFAAFFEIASGARLDGQHRRIRLLPLTLFGFVVSAVATSRAVIAELLPGGEFHWHKTSRFRTPESGVGPPPGARPSAAVTSRADGSATTHAGAAPLRAPAAAGSSQRELAQAGSHASPLPTVPSV